MSSAASHALDRYQKMRDFGGTPEPSGKRDARARSRAKAPSQKAARFVVQEHHATRHHYDLRLELDGVYKSWAIPKTPTIDAGEKRLAVETEDHPLEYGTFEGVIPKGHYGAGHVAIWDRGAFVPLDDDPMIALKKGHIRFGLRGARLDGEYSLVRLAAKEGEKKSQWLFLRHRGHDAASADSRDAHHGPSAGDALPQTFGVQLAKLVETPPRGDGWIFEIKYDGYRALAVKDGDDVHLVSRNGLDMTERFASVAEHVAKLKVDRLVLDGEICALDAAGHTRFEALQNADEHSELVYVVFDVLFAGKRDLRDRPLRERKETLTDVVPATKRGVVRRADHVATGDGAKAFAAACELGLEGLVAKRLDAPYRAGRSQVWRKMRCDERQEMVVVGYTPPSGARTGFGALLLGVHDRAGHLRYAGKVGTGFAQAALVDLKRRLAAMKVDEPPVADAPRLRNATWVRPELVAEVRFTEWTRDGKLRHPTFLGLRTDKPAKDVVRERAKPVARVQKKPTRTETDEIAGVRVTHPERVLEGASGLTKRALAEYLQHVAPHLLRHAKNRYLALVRCPDGHAAPAHRRGGEGPCFFQKHAMPGMTTSIHREVGADGEERLYVKDVAGLVSLAQLSVLEIHGWGSRHPHLEHPDWMVLDLDPAPDVAWKKVVEAARDVHDRLARIGLTSFVKTTGGKGLHVVVPLVPSQDFAVVKQLSELFALTLAQREPARFTANLSKRARDGKIFVDYLRNGRGATAIVPYSTRARANAPVALPIEWKELSSIDPAEATIAMVTKRTKRRGDAWAAMWDVDQRIDAHVVEALSRR